MGLGDLCSIEMAFAEGALDPSLRVRALGIATQETGSVGTIQSELAALLGALARYQG